MKLKATKKWEVKAGKNRGLYIAVAKDKSAKFFPQWGILNADYNYPIYKRHKVNPDTHYIITTSTWARVVMRPRWEKVTTN